MADSLVSVGSSSLLGLLSSQRIMETHNPVRELTAGEQFERQRAMPRGHQRNSFADKSRNHMNDKLIDLPFVEERRYDSRATHHPDVFALRCAEAFCEFTDWLSYKLNSGRIGLRRTS